MQYCTFQGYMKCSALIYSHCYPLLLFITHTGSENQRCDSRGQCTCKPGVTGLKCDRCEANYYDFGTYGCRPCNCVVEGSFENKPYCDSRTGQCTCKVSEVSEADLVMSENPNKATVFCCWAIVFRFVVALWGFATYNPNYSFLCSWRWFVYCNGQHNYVIAQKVKVFGGSCWLHTIYYVVCNVIHVL